MQFKLKPVSKKAIPEAPQKGKRYHLIREPALAESIRLDILQAGPAIYATRARDGALWSEGPGIRFTRAKQ